MKSFASLRASLLVAAVLAAPAALLSGNAQAAESAAAAKPDLKKGEAISTQVCAACHTNDGSRGAPAYPILQGQHPEYIVKQLADFKSGARSNPIMSGMAAPLSEDDMRNVAAFYAGKNAKPGFAKHKDLVKLGEKIYRGGIAGLNVPACAGCHSPDGAGIPAQYPRLAGQQADYIEAQLLAFRDSVRKNSPQMRGVTLNLSDTDIKALADYIAGLR
ncbi:MAG TPA: c-type cytochrome [Methylibium sp.]